MRLAGTARQYSKKAMPQLTSTTCHSATLGNFNWPYQAKVIKTLEQNRRTMGRRAVMGNASVKGRQMTANRSCLDSQHGNDTALAARPHGNKSGMGCVPAADANGGPGMRLWRGGLALILGYFAVIPSARPQSVFYTPDHQPAAWDIDQQPA